MPARVNAWALTIGKDDQEVRLSSAGADGQQRQRQQRQQCHHDCYSRSVSRWKNRPRIKLSLSQFTKKAAKTSNALGWWCGGVWVHERGRNVESTLSYGRLLAILGLF